MARITHVLAIDAGGTKTAAALLAVDGQERARCALGPCNLYQDPDAGIEVLLAAWQELATHAGLDRRVGQAATCVSAGIAGIGSGHLAHLDRAFAGFAARRWSSDGYVGLIGAFAGGPGALLSIGTGVVGCRRDEAGRFTQLGGWGFPIGDHGGGAWLGFRLVGDHLRWRDGYGPETAGPALWGRVTAVVGDCRDAILGWLRAARPADFGSLAPLVLGAAEAGDGYANGLLEEAESHLVRLARALAPSPAAPLCLGGGLAQVFAPRIASALGPELVDLERRPDALGGAHLIGLGQAPAELDPGAHAPMSPRCG